MKIKCIYIYSIHKQNSQGVNIYTVYTFCLFCSVGMAFRIFVKCMENY